jgi:uncharacterized protein YkwD
MNEILTILGTALTVYGSNGMAHKPCQPIRDRVPAPITQPAPVIVPQTTVPTPQPVAVPQATAPTSTADPRLQLIADIHTKVNAYRVSQGKPALAIDTNIQSIAQSGAQLQANANQMSHDGFSDRARAIGNVSVAENVAAGYPTAESVVNGWINSPGHRANILGSFSRSGVGVAYTNNGTPYYTHLFAQ